MLSIITIYLVPFLSESIQFIPLPQLAFEDLIKNPHQTIGISQLTHETHLFARLTYNPDDTLGKGTFKTAVSAALQFNNRIPEIGLGSDVKINHASSIPVALKRPFIQPKGKVAQNRSGTSGKVSRMPFLDEKRVISGEARLLVWANALLSFAHSFIDSHINSAESIPDFLRDRPAFRFVDAGIALALKPLEEPGGAKATSYRAIYLLEERLPGASSNFVKYINNSNAIPILESDDPDYETAVYLTFIQHVQYQITHGLAYVSDFQGELFFEIAQINYVESVYQVLGRRLPILKS